MAITPFSLSSGLIFSTHDAAGDACRPNKLTKLVNAGKLVRLTPGSYVDAEAFAALNPEERHRLRVEAVVAGISGPILVSHYSALVLLGLPTYAVDLSRVHVARVDGRLTRSRPGLTVHSSYGEIATFDFSGMHLVDPTVAALGTAMVGGIESGVVALDGVLAKGLTSDSHVRRWLDCLEGHPRSRRARRAAELADGRSESVGESRTRLLLGSLDVGPVRPQVEIRDDAQRFVGRVDFLLPRYGVIVEFDGLVKYGANDAREAIIAEKLREDRLRALGFIVVRLVWKDLDVPGRVGDKVRKACARARANA